MIVLDDPTNPFLLIFSIRKILNDLLDLERLNRPGESVPSRESRTSTLKGLFLLEGPAAALLPSSLFSRLPERAERGSIPQVQTSARIVLFVDQRGSRTPMISTIVR